MKIKTFVALTIIFLLFSFSCKETPPEPRDGTGSNGMLIVEDVGVTDAVLRLRLPGGLMNRTVTLKRQNTKQQNDTATIYLSPLITHRSPIDTLIIDESLLPKQSYRYTLTLANIFNLKERSYTDVTTMDTMSHNFTWQIDTLGDGNSSILRDVVIINDTCVMAVGEINIKDSLGNWMHPPYNLARWNGKEWSLKRVMYNYQGTDYYSQLYSIFAFNENNYWIGNKWETFDLGSEIWNGWINKILGSSSSNIHIVGNQGAIAFFNGSSWQKMETSTDVNLTDVWGSPDGKVVWACGWEDFKPTVLLKYENGVLTKQYEEYSDRFRIREDSLSGVLIGGSVVQRKSMVILSNYGIYKTSSDTRGKGRRIYEIYDGFTGFPFGMRSTDINDIIIAGTRGYIAHYNGVNFYRYEETKSSNVYFSSVAIKKNMAAAVGWIYHPYNGKAIVCIGRR